MEPILSTKTLGDVVSDTWNIYKDNFWRIVAISAIVQIPAGIIIAIIILILVGTGVASGLFEEPDPEILFSGPFVAVLVAFFGLLMAAVVVMFIVLEGAVTHAVCQHYVWKQVDVSLAFRRAFRRFWPMLGAMILLFLSIAAIMTFTAILFVTIDRFVTAFAFIFGLIGILFAVYLGVRWYFVFQMALLEDASPLEALRGSSELVQGNWWRVVGITFVLSLIVSAVTFLPTFIPLIGPIFVNIVALPAYTIVKTVLYCDLRMRADGAEQFNKDVLARDLGLLPVEEEGWSKFDPA